jgi:hypothetical protein
MMRSLIRITGKMDDRFIALAEIVTVALPANQLHRDDSEFA